MGGDFGDAEEWRPLFQGDITIVGTRYYFSLSLRTVTSLAVPSVSFVSGQSSEAASGVPESAAARRRLGCGAN